MTRIGQRPICLVCGDRDASCPVCEGMRAGILHRQARREEARQWVVDNLGQQHLGQFKIVIPSSPEEFEMMVMAIMAYARGDAELPDASEDPRQCERFQRIEFREKES